jgi:hypothetical protein
MKCYIWSTALHGAETWALQKEIRNTLRVLKCGAEKDGASSTDRVKNKGLHNSQGRNEG